MGLVAAAVSESRAKWHAVASSYGGFGGFGDELGFDGRHRDDRPDIRNAEDGIRLPVIWGCLRVRAGRLSTVSPSCDDGAVPGWLRHPVPASGQYPPMPLGEFITRTSVSLDTYGTAYWGVSRETRGGVQALFPLDAAFINFQYDGRNGRYKFGYNGNYGLEIMVVPGLLLPDWPLGLSPISFQQMLFRTSKAGQRQAAHYFTDSSIIPGVISSEGNMTPEQAKLMRRNWRQAHSGPERGYLPAYIGNGKWQSIGMNAEQAQFLTSRQYTDTQVAQQIFGVDPTLLGLPGTGKSLTYTTLQSRESALLVELQPTIDRIAAAFSWLNGGNPVNLVPKTWVSERERFEIYERAARVSQALGEPVLTVDEIRRREGMEPLTDEQKTAGALTPSGPGTLGDMNNTDLNDKVAALEAQLAALEGN